MDAGARRAGALAAAAGAVVVAAVAAPAVAQNALDRNLQVGAGRVIPRTVNSVENARRFQEAVIFGRAPNGLSFRDTLDSFDPTLFTDTVGSTELFNFNRDAATSILATRGVRGSDALAAQGSLLTGGSLGNDPSILRVLTPVDFATPVTAGRIEAAQQERDFRDLVSRRPATLTVIEDGSGGRFRATASTLRGLQFLRDRAPGTGEEALLRQAQGADPTARPAENAGPVSRGPGAAAPGLAFPPGLLSPGDRIGPDGEVIKPDGTVLDASGRVLEPARAGGSLGAPANRVGGGPIVDRVQTLIDPGVVRSPVGGGPVVPPVSPSPGPEGQGAPPGDAPALFQLRGALRDASLRQGPASGERPDGAPAGPGGPGDRPPSEPAPEGGGVGGAPNGLSGVRQRVQEQWERDLEGLRRRLSEPADGRAGAAADGGAPARGVGQGPSWRDQRRAALGLPADPSGAAAPDDQAQRAADRERRRRELEEDPGVRRGLELLTRVEVAPLTTLVPAEGTAARDVRAAMVTAESHLRQGQYFAASRAFQSAVQGRAGVSPDVAVLAAMGAVHAQLGAGQYLSAGTTLRQVLQVRPDIVSTRWGPGVLIAPARAQAAAAELSALVADRQSPALGEAGLLLAYLGRHHRNTAWLTEGLIAVQVAEDRGRSDLSAIRVMISTVWGN
ncbi:MAG: hypothetical protein C0475_04780 [Planctomyces sp.]|nr:hypothetical protein [Planctomyces sp.]